MIVPQGNTPITVNDLQLKTALDIIKRKKNRLNTSTSSVPKVSTCKGILVSEYENKIKEISKLLDEYKTLLTKDLADADTTREYFAQIDQQLSKVFQKIE